MKKTIYKIFALMLAVVMMLMSLSCISFAGNEFMIPGTDAAEILEDPTNTFECYLIDNCVRIIKYLKNDENVVIPNEIAGYKVTEIASEVFMDNNNIKSVTIPDTVIEISSFAFESCVNLIEINMSKNILFIGENAFHNTAYFNEKNNWDGEVLYISNYLVATDSKISGKYRVRDGVTVVASSAFKECTLLTEVVFPDSLLVIGNEAFYNCNSLKNADLPQNLKSIGVSAFEQCGLETISIPSNVEMVGYNSFASCEMLDFIEIADDVTDIVSSAFYNTKFYNKQSNWENGVLYIDNHLIDVEPSIVSGDYVVKSGTRTISDGVFNDCDNLKSVTLNDGIMIVGEWTFANCDKLESVFLPDSVTTIEASAFRDSDKLESIVIPKNVTTINESAFYHCDNLKKVTLNGNIIEIDYGNFESCNELLTLYGYSNTVAEDYAKENEIAFVSIGVKETKGDTNGDGNISATDARIVLQAVAGTKVLSDEAKKTADVNCDGKITAVDARYILQIVAGLK